MYSGKNWLRIERIDETAIHLRCGNLGAPNIQPRAALLHGAAADEQRRLRPEHQQAQAHAPFYDWVGKLLCEDDASRGTGR
ncbi:hypothetical protein GFS31_24270 [Leptolyngbya sp. BL0902]|uniref:hypothetical protein n=1 Tax=Leptolyngbya sp. BL0902 TaxID=1115757 RepID=UPI0018E75932|nr:hypothetical protein [Leptolyngbya sp. BL0902]QQE65739.1 hypothetical protein GFS31_24270 [Leptolyngbya sp. BL0902]